MKLRKASTIAFDDEVVSQKLKLNKFGWLEWLAAIALAIAAYIAFAPLEFVMPHEGLDPSWVAVLGEARSRGWKFGTDINFTGGPLSSIYSRYFNEETFATDLFVVFILCIAISAVLTVTAILNRRMVAAFFSAVVIAWLHRPTDPLFGLASLGTALVAFSPVRTSYDRNLQIVAMVLGVMAASLATMAKFSVAPLSIFIMVAVDLERAITKKSRVPLFTLGYFGLLLLFFSILAGPSNFWNWLVGSFLTSAGYTEAMFAPGPLEEVGAFLALAITFATIVIAVEFLALNEVAFATSVARFLAVAAYAFIVWKGGFVRQDMHTLIGWSGLSLLAAAYWTAAPRVAFTRWSGFHLLLPAVSAIGLLVAIPMVWSYHSKQHAALFLGNNLSNVFIPLDTAAKFLSDPKASIESWKKQKDAAWAQVRKAYPLPLVNGSVDAIPSIQSSVIAHKMNYKPRYTIQEYTTYGRGLIEGNRISLTNTGPDYLFFSTNSIDNRHPALSEGPLWPDILRYYQPSESLSDLLVLQRRSQPLGALLQNPVRSSTGFGQSISVEGKEATFLKVGLKHSLLGKLANILYRPPLVTVEIEAQDGQKFSYRLVPGIASEGFLVSPRVVAPKDFLLLSTGDTSNLLGMKSIIISTSSIGRLTYTPQIDIEMSSFDLQILRDQAFEPVVRQVTTEALGYAALTKGRPSKPNSMRDLPGGLLAHAPLDLDVTVPFATSELEIGFGIFDGAWTPGDGTLGLCFAAELPRAANSGASFSRCLNPKEFPADRGVQSVRLKGPFKRGDVIRLQTSCRINCAYGWSYWAFLRPAG